MKKYIILAMTIISFGAVAQINRIPLEKQKEGIIKFMDERIVELNDGKKCIANAKDQAAFDACREKMAQVRKEVERKREELIKAQSLKK